MSMTDAGIVMVSLIVCTTLIIIAYMGRGKK